MNSHFRSILPLAAFAASLAFNASAQVVFTPGGSIGSIGGSNVGIGTSAPWAKLDVVGDVRAGGSSWTGFYTAANGAIATLRVTDTGSYGTTVGFVGTDTPNPFVIRAAAQPVAWFATNGNVGLGTFAPAGRLHVAGPDVLMFLQDTNGGGRTYSLGSRWGGYFTLFDEADGSQARLSIAPNGNVGVGTTLASGKLQVGITNLWNVSEGLELARLGGATSRFSFKLKSDASGYYRGALEFTPNGGTLTEAVTVGNEVLGGAGAGNVGIGTTTPGTRLEVKGDETRLRGIVNKNDGTLRNLLRLTSDDTVGTNNLELSFGLQGGAGGSRRAQIQAADNGYYWAPLVLNPYGGNIGIGNTSPGFKIDIGGAGVGSAAPAVAFNEWNVRQWAIGAGISQSGKLSVMNGSTGLPALTIDGNSNVGIGTTNPTNKLEVNGTIRTKEVIVETNGWADYVLAKGYPLAPLSEVEAHIASTGTLPGIPSAADVAAHGVSVGDMQAKLLAKLEELTLHQIAQEKRMTELAAENAQLKQAVAELKATR